MTGEEFRLPDAKLVTSPRYVRARLGGHTLATSTSPLLYLDYRRTLPTYFFNQDEIEMDLLSDPVEEKGRRYWTVTAGDLVAPRAAWAFAKTPKDFPEMDDHITFTWDGPVTWYEESEQVYVHARDPFKRIDTLKSRRHIQVKVGGEMIADTHTPVILFETHLPVRYYVPRVDVRLDLLQPTDTISRCAYKGRAQYWSVVIGDEVYEDVVWSYPVPRPPYAKITDLICFYNEKVDIYIDGVLEEKPKTVFG